MKLSVIAIALLAFVSFTSMADARNVRKRDNGIHGTIQSINGNEITIEVHSHHKGAAATSSTSSSSSSSASSSSSKKTKAPKTVTVTLSPTTTVLVDGSVGVKLDSSLVGKSVLVQGSKDTTGKYNVATVTITTKSTKSPSNK